MHGVRLVKQVKRKAKPGAKILCGVMIAGAVLCVLMGIVFDRGFMLPAFLFAALYFGFSTASDRDYEYNYEDGVLTIDVITGKRHRKRVHELRLMDLEVVAPNYHEAVAKYRRNGGTERLPKFDYTSYEEDIPYYTMIIHENGKKIKLLLDLDEELLRAMKGSWPSRVYIEEKSSGEYD